MYSNTIRVSTARDYFHKYHYYYWCQAVAESVIESFSSPKYLFWSVWNRE